MCIGPKGLTFRNSKKRTIWLAKRYGELEEGEALRRWGSSSDGGGVCEGSGGSSSVGSCYNNGGYRYDPKEAPAGEPTSIPVEMTPSEQQVFGVVSLNGPSLEDN